MFGLCVRTAFGCECFECAFGVFASAPKADVHYLSFTSRKMLHVGSGPEETANTKAITRRVSLVFEFVTVLKKSDYCSSGLV